MSNINVDDAILLSLYEIEKHGSSVGRTVIQKILYFASKKGCVDIGYTHYYYGPYSREVDNKLNNLVTFGLVTEKKELLNKKDEKIRYRYALPENVKDYVQNDLLQSEESSKMLEIVDTLYNACNLDYKKISFAAKVDYIMQEYSVSDENEVSKKAKELGWEIKHQDYDDAKNMLNAMSEMSA